MLEKYRYSRNWLAQLTRPGHLPLRLESRKAVCNSVQLEGLRSLGAGGLRFWSEPGVLDIHEQGDGRLSSRQRRLSAFSPRWLDDAHCPGRC